MSTEAAHAKPPRLTDMDLSIGQTLQLITHDPRPLKYFSQLVGFVEREFIMLRVPQENGWAVPLKEGMSFDVRVFSGIFIHEFQSQLQTLLLTPRNFMLLSCPTGLKTMKFRSHERVKCALPVHILQSALESSSCVGFEFQDLSGSGASLLGPLPLGQPGQQIRLQLDFHLMATDTQEHIELIAEIQTLKPWLNATGQSSGYEHGIRFADIEPRILLLVSQLQKRHTH